jgi:hypothetical protein
MLVLSAFSNTLEKNSFGKRTRFFVIIFTVIIVWAIAYSVLDFNETVIEGKTKYFAYNSVVNPNKDEEYPQPDGTTRTYSKWEVYAQRIWNKIYVSITTLTTLGYGDIYPIHPISQALVAVQTLFSYVIITDLI